MRIAHDYFPQCPEALIVSLARSGDRGAFAELVRRRQSSVRGLMRRCCNDVTLADDLAQQVFLKAWLKIRTLKHHNAFGSWLKRLAINTWLQYLRKNDALRNADELVDFDIQHQEQGSIGMDLDGALALLPDTVRLCLVLNYQEGMSHREVEESTGIPLGTVKSHINRGAERLRLLLSAYNEGPGKESSP